MAATFLLSAKWWRRIWTRISSSKRKRTRSWPPPGLRIVERRNDWVHGPDLQSNSVLVLTEVFGSGIGLAGKGYEGLVETARIKADGFDVTGPCPERGCSGEWRLQLVIQDGEAIHRRGLAAQHQPSQG